MHICETKVILQVHSKFLFLRKEVKHTIKYICESWLILVAVYFNAVESFPELPYFLIDNVEFRRENLV